MFVLIALVIAGIVALFLGDYWVRARSYRITVYFENVQGLTEGAEVRLAGVRIGRVTGVSLERNAKFPNRPAAVALAIYRDIIVYTTDTFVIQQGALLGDKYVEVQRTDAAPKQRVAAGGEVAGGTVQGIEDLTAEARSLVAEARTTLGQMRNIFASEFNAQALRAILTNVMSATAKADTLASQAMQLATILTAEARRTGPKMAKIADDLSQASASVSSTAQLVRNTLATSPIPRDAAIATENLRTATADVARITDNFAQVLATPETRQKMEAALDNMHTATEGLARVSAAAEKLLPDESASEDLRLALCRLREAAEHISSIAKTYDEVLTDPQFTGDLQATISAARQAAEAGARTLEKAESSLGRVDKTLSGLGNIVRAASPDDIRVRSSLEVPQKASRHLDVDVDLQYGENRNNFWRVGIRDVGGDGRLNLQRSFPTGNNRFRAGLIGGEPGAGYDITSDRLNVEAELWNPDDLRFDIRAGYGIMPRVDVLLGVGDIGDSNDPFVGVRYKTND